jgi:hypothetical protein
MTIIWFTFLALFILQVILAGILRGKFSRPGVWLVMLGSVFLMHWVLIGESGFMRMIWICSVLMVSMKMITYREWCAAGNRKLTWPRWLMFSCLWFGMDPGAFVTRRKVEWKSHIVVGGLCLISGLIVVWVCYLLDVRNVVILFISMSAGFHFGILRLLTAFWRMQGFPVRVLFRNPLKMRGFRDFWSKRWNLGYSHMIARAVKKPLTPLLGENGSVFAVFAVSGLLHELAITVPVGAGYGWPTLFFLLHGAICFFEKRDSVFMGGLCGVVLILGLPFLFGERFVEEIILPSRNVLEYFN